MELLTKAQLGAAAARRFLRRRGAHKTARRRADMTAAPVAPNMAGGPEPEGTALALDPDTMTVEELRAALRARGIRYHGRAGHTRLAGQLREALDGDHSG